MTWTDSAHGLRGVKETRKPLREASTLPGGLYHDPDICREELRRIFSKPWHRLAATVGVRYHEPP